jgi:O-antigen/teichoic acid export membrane protein
MKLNLKENKQINNKWNRIAASIILYSILMYLLPRTTGYLTVIAVIIYTVYLFVKDQKFKEKSIWTKILIIIALCFVLLFGLSLTTLSPESLEKVRSAAQK